MINKILFVVFMSVIAFAEELIISLPTQNSLQPIYIAEITAKKSPLPDEYRLALDRVLCFDFEHNGRTRVETRLSKYESILGDVDYQKAFYPKIWQELPVAYVVRAYIEGKELHTSVYLAKTSVVKHFNTVHLSGKLDDDRRLIHRLSDGIFYELFKTKGIASTKVLYTYQPSHKTSISEIWECDYDGANAYPVTHDNVQSLTPTAIGSKFAYACYKSGQTKIFTSNRNHQSGTPLIALSGNQFHPSFSSRGDMLAFTSDNQGRNDLYLQKLNAEMKPIGKPIQLYAYPKSVTASPSFSPDGKQMAFVSDQSGNPKIYLIDIPDTILKRPDTRQLTTQHNSCVCPTWAPDGSKIAYTAKIDGVRQIWIYDTQSKSTKQLTTGDKHKENPTWAPNSQHIIYNTTEGDIYDLYLIHLQNPKPIKITKGIGLKHYPCWIKNSM